MQRDTDPRAAIAGERGPSEPDSSTTLGYTTERSLWRAATVMADGGDADSLSIDGEHVEDAVADPKGRYHLREVLGVGGMGEVRLCRDEAIGREVALKTLLDTRDTSAHAQRRFLREARVQGQLEHPSIVPVYDLGTGPDGGLFFTMRRVRGHTLAEVLDALGGGDASMLASHSRRKLLAAFVRVCLAIDYAHTRGVLHRDLKPSNIMLGDFGEVYVLDWGIARLVTDRATSAPVVVPRADLAGQGSMVGTPGYMSPEQLLGLGDSQDARTDVYSLGVILFEILTLRRLHQGSSFEELAESTRLTLSARASAVAADVPPELDAACARAASSDRAQRFASARELADAVERYLDGDRDMERRRDLSTERAVVAAAAFAQVAAPDASEQATAIGRADAVREVTAALALNPDNAEARRLLMRLFVEAPARMPREVVAEMDAAIHRNRDQYLRYGTYVLASWIFTAPVVVAMGVRSWPPVLLCTALSIFTFLWALWARRIQNLSVGMRIGLSALTLATVASVSCFMGPFVVIPQLIAICTLYIALTCKTARERWMVTVLGALAAGLPFAVEVLGLVPPAYVFADGSITLFERAVHFSPQATVPMLLYVSVTTAALPPIFLGHIRDALSAAEQRLFLQSWHLRQLLPEERAAPMKVLAAG